jgi:Cu/Ag efflux protein CusF
MQKRLLAVIIAFAAGLAVSASAQTVVATSPGKGAVAQTIKATVTITKIDAASRAVTVKGAKGHEVTIICGPEVKNFDQMKVGDQVDVEYVEALTLELKKGSTAVVSRTSTDAMGTAKPGQMPAMVAGRQTTIVAEVVGLDAATQTVTLKGPNRTVDLTLHDPAQFKRVSMGDKVEAVFTEAAAISVRPAAKK